MTSNPLQVASRSSASGQVRCSCVDVDAVDVCVWIFVIFLHCKSLIITFSSRSVYFIVAGRSRTPAICGRLWSERILVAPLIAFVVIMRVVSKAGAILRDEFRAPDWFLCLSVNIRLQVRLQVSVCRSRSAERSVGPFRHSILESGQSSYSRQTSAMTSRVNNGKRHETRPAVLEISCCQMPYEFVSDLHGRWCSTLLLLPLLLLPVFSLHLSHPSSCTPCTHSSPRHILYTYYTIY